MSDLTAADLARIEQRHERRVEIHHAVDGTPVGPFIYCAVGAERWPCDTIQLVATVRELARAIAEHREDGRGWYGDPGCPFCAGDYSGLSGRVVHETDCIVHRARALLGEE